MSPYYRNLLESVRPLTEGKGKSWKPSTQKALRKGKHSKLGQKPKYVSGSARDVLGATRQEIRARQSEKQEGVTDAVTRRILYKTIWKKLRKKGEEMGTRAAASPEGQKVLKKAGVLTLPTRVASKIKVRAMDAKKKLKGKK